MSKHTPGPWEIEQDGEQSAWRIDSDRYRGIAYVPHALDARISDATAQLIAAAPDLLEAAKEVWKWWEEIYPPGIFTGASGDSGAVCVVKIRKLLEQAINKAEGNNES